MPTVQSQRSFRTVSQSQSHCFVAHSSAQEAPLFALFLHRTLRDSLGHDGIGRTTNWRACTHQSGAASSQVWRPQQSRFFCTESTDKSTAYGAAPQGSIFPVADPIHVTMVTVTYTVPVFVRPAKMLTPWLRSLSVWRHDIAVTATRHATKLFCSLELGQNGVRWLNQTALQSLSSHGFRSVHSRKHVSR